MRYLVIVSIMLIVQSSSITASSEEGFGVGPTQEDGHNRGSETSKFGSSTETGEGEFSAASSGLVGVGSVRPATKTRAKAPEVAVADPLTAPPVAPAVLERVASPAKTEAPAEIAPTSGSTATGSPQERLAMAAGVRTVGKIEVANMKKDDGTYVDRTEVFNPGGTSNNRGKVFGPDFAPRDLASLVGKPGIMEVDGTKYEIKVRMASKTELQGLNLNGVPGAPRLNVFQAQGESVRVGVVEDLKWPLSKMGVMDENFSNYGTDKPMSRNERTSTELTKFYYNLDTGALIGGGGGMGGGKTNQEAKPK